MFRNAPTKALRRWLGYAALLTSIGFISSVNAAEMRTAYSRGGVPWPYELTKTGDNFTFEFKSNPGALDQQLAAALQVMQGTYGDQSIAARYAQFYTKEGAKCFVYPSDFYSYTTCFLPNDYSPDKKSRFWGYVTRVPNGMWLITRSLLPALFGAGLFLLWLRKARLATPASLPESSGNYRPIP